MAVSYTHLCLQLPTLSASQVTLLQELLTAKGRSFSDPIYRADGTVDRNASRRVVIKFRMNDEEMVNQMLELRSQNAPAQTAEPAATDAPTAAPEN